MHVCTMAGLLAQTHRLRSCAYRRHVRFRDAHDLLGLADQLRRVRVGEIAMFLSASTIVAQI